MRLPVSIYAHLVVFPFQFQKVRRGYLVPVTGSAAAVAAAAANQNGLSNGAVAPQRGGPGAARLITRAASTTASIAEIAATMAANEQPPQRAVTDTRQLHITASILHIDFEGRSDGEAMKRLVSTFKAREVGVRLKDFPKQALLNDRIFSLRSSLFERLPMTRLLWPSFVEPPVTWSRNAYTRLPSETPSM